MADWDRRMSNGPSKYVAAKICMIPAMLSSRPITAKGFFGRASCSGVIALFSHPYLATGTMYANDNGIWGMGG